MAEEPTTPPSPPPHKHRLPLGYYANWAAAEARRFRRELTRENLQAFLKTMAWVAPLTLLIWVYAEREETDTAHGIEVHLDLSSRQGDKIITMVYPSDHGFMVDVSGPHNKVEEFQNMITRDLKAQLYVPANTTQLSHLPVIPLLQDDPLFKEEGLSITSCAPEYMDVSVDVQQTLDLPVKVPPNLSNVQVTFNPPTVKVSGPSRALANLQPAGAVLADISSDITKGPGSYSDPAVQLIPPSQDSQVTMTPSTVQASITVKESDVTVSLPPVPVLLLIDQHLLTQYNITPDLNVHDVKLVGPQEGIDKIDNDKLVAVLELEEADMKDTGQKPVKIVALPDLTLPDGVHMAPDSNPVVTYHTTER